MPPLQPSRRETSPPEADKLPPYGQLNHGLEPDDPHELFSIDLVEV